MMRRGTERGFRVVGALLALVLVATTVRAENRCIGGGLAHPPSIPGEGGISGSGRSSSSAPVESGISGSGRSAAPGEGGISGSGRSNGPGEGGISGSGLTADAGTESGIGGTGEKPAAKPGEQEGGINGTGRAVPSASGEGGIGGTGERRGIVGTVTGFASICVGGVEIGYATSTPVLVDGAPGASGDLAIGQVVEVLADGNGDQVIARRITVRPVLRGPITAVDVAGDTLSILGQRVVLNAATRCGIDGEDAAVSAGDFQIGAFVQVSGLRRGNAEILASRVDRIAAGDATLVGPLDRIDAAHATLSVAGVDVRLKTKGEAAGLSRGNEVAVSGVWDGRTLSAAHLERPDQAMLKAGVATLDLEGFVAPGSASGTLRIGAWTLRTSSVSAAGGKAETGQRVQVRALVSKDGSLTVESLRPAVDVPHAPPPAAAGDGGGAGGGSSSGSQAKPPPSKEPRPPVEKPRPGPPGSGPGGDGSGAGSGSGMPPRPDGPPHPPGGGDRPGPPDRPAPPDRPDRPAPPDRPDRPDVPHPPDRPDRPDVPHPPDRPDRPDVPHPPDRPDRPDVPHPPDRADRPDRPDVPRRR